ncbi:MAG: putative hydro-lyase [Rhodospirillales bacterium]|jgi:uncharacterized protein YcsI (UPF0317 family)|nr:putative hydro-lyase [Rhodospirillales bacterium]
MASGLSPAELRRLCRGGSFDGPTSGLAAGYVQANMVILPEADAEAFAEYCASNPKPCPILERLAPGDPEPRKTAPGADVRTDLPRYRVFQDGRPIAEPADIQDLWRDDLVTFLLGCSFTAEEALAEAGLPLHHIEQTGFVPMYITSLATEPAGRFSGPLVVSMRPFTVAEAERAAEITRHYPIGHGAPIHMGDPAVIGIDDLDAPDYGQPVRMTADQTTVFWACGVTPQEAILRAKPELAISHAPGHMFVSDITARSTRV